MQINLVLNCVLCVECLEALLPLKTLCRLPCYFNIII